MAEIKKIDHNKQLDLLTVYFTEKIEHPLEKLEGPIDGILFEVDSETHELMSITIYDYTYVKRELMKKFISIMTQKAILNWIKSLADTFRIGNKYQLEYA